MQAYNLCHAATQLIRAICALQYAGADRRVHEVCRERRRRSDGGAKGQKSYWVRFRADVTLAQDP